MFLFYFKKSYKPFTNIFYPIVLWVGANDNKIPFFT